MLNINFFSKHILVSYIFHSQMFDFVKKSLRDQSPLFGIFFYTIYNLCSIRIIWLRILCVQKCSIMAKIIYRLVSIFRDSISQNIKIFKSIIMLATTHTAVCCLFINNMQSDIRSTCHTAVIEVGKKSCFKKFFFISIISCIPYRSLASVNMLHTTICTQLTS